MAPEPYESNQNPDKTAEHDDPEDDSLCLGVCQPDPDGLCMGCGRVLYLLDPKKETAA